MTQPTLRYWSWSKVVPQFLSMAVLVTLWWLLLPPGNIAEPFMFGAGTYLFYSYGSRLLIPSAHRRGMKAMSRENYEAAISEFEASYKFFSEHAWLDKYRAIMMMSPSIWSYREMALMNIASVYAAQGNYEAAKTACQRVLEEYPDNKIAKSTIEMIRSNSPQSEA